MTQYNKLTPEILEQLKNAAPGHILTGAEINEDYSHDEMPIYGKQMPDALLMATSTEEVAAVMNIGVQPTLPSGRVTVEAHILEGEPELYGQEVSLFPGDRFREEKKFDSVQELTNQIRKDQEAARAWFQRLPDGKDGRKTDSPVPCVRKTGDV